MAKKQQVPGVEEFDGPAGGWPALGAVARAVRDQMAVADELRALKRVNQPDGFDCPGCAWPDPKHTSSFEFCENGAKAVAWEATGKRAGPEFFAGHSVAELWSWSDHRLEDIGRLTHPMRYEHATDRYVAVDWDEAFAGIGAALRAVGDPDAVEFYASGRASNEAAFLWQLFAREFGTNNFPDCSNMCHEATSVGLPESIGFGKGTVSLEDFEHCDAIFSIGHNPGTNHPRMLSTLRAAARRGVPIVVINPMRERGLERFASPQHPLEMLTGGETRLATTYSQPRVGGDIAVLQGIMKALLAEDAAQCEAGGAGLLDREFISRHTEGFEALGAELATLDWPDIEARSGLGRADMEALAAIYARADRVIVCYGMGITQHRHGTQNVQQIANLLLLRGNIGRPGAGICPLRGHSNVQGDRTVGITEAPTEAWCAALEGEFGIRVPRRRGHNAVEAVQAISQRRSRAMLCLGGNLAVAMSDPDTVFPALRGLDLSVHIATKLNRSHLLVGQGQSFLLPCLGRTERDVQEGGEQFVTVEDSMSMVHASRGSLAPASDQLRSEPAIVAGIAGATLPDSRVDWRHLVADYARIRAAIEAVHPDFRDYEERISTPGGFHLENPAARRQWHTPTGRARFLCAGAGPAAPAPDVLQLATVRSHDQYNTTIYGFDDRYRGVRGRRDVVFAHPDDLAALGLAHGDRVDIEAVDGGAGTRRRLRGYTVIAGQIARGSLAAYYPEANALLSLDSHDRQSGTPAYKSIPVRLRAAAAE
ncbi:FdhF/YdeP family oxidoreductase [Pseudomarimonas salicorniae]|uniref:FdhF/YdeP family oxidoreductase n=1 Tax=Pseudomarimonas salicorniae TaxID=2933270 RepID=A0ABT0GGC1_9GAMM|nr:FdhF/YdeP family oxidoreductase [Lysobacter sp. CAU 1642]MCK7593488.1 FdhF/YdeP family oxidoreductase [Lysobacter sp. CAU 1642]